MQVARIAAREVAALLRSPVAYVVAIAFLVVQGLSNPRAAATAALDQSTRLERSIRRRHGDRTHFQRPGQGADGRQPSTAA